MRGDSEQASVLSYEAANVPLTSVRRRAGWGSIKLGIITLAVGMMYAAVILVEWLPELQLWGLMATAADVVASGITWLSLGLLAFGSTQLWLGVRVLRGGRWHSLACMCFTYVYLTLAAIGVLCAVVVFALAGFDHDIGRIVAIVCMVIFGGSLWAMYALLRLHRCQRWVWNHPNEDMPVGDRK